MLANGKLGDMMSEGVCAISFVMMKDGTKKMIKDVKVGDLVATWNPRILMFQDLSVWEPQERVNKEYSRVINQYVRKTDKKMYKITTKHDEIIATDDHKFMVLSNYDEVEMYYTWKEVKNINPEKDCLVKIDDDPDFYENANKNRQYYFNDSHIKSIELYTETKLISDITIESDNHTFFAGKANFLVSNSAEEWST